VQTSTRLLTLLHSPSHIPEQTLVTFPLKRLIVALAFVLPTAAFVASPVMAKSKSHHSSVHKASTHHSPKKPAATPAS
jgi:hypothetical protein